MRRMHRLPIWPDAISIMRALKAGVKAALKAHLKLDARLLNGGQRLVNLGQVERQRLFAKNVFARPGGILDHERMRIGAGRDHDGFDAVIRQKLTIVRGDTPDSQFIRHSLRHIQPDVAHGDQVRLWNAPDQVARVHTPHPACPNHADIDLVFHVYLLNGMLALARQQPG